MIDMKEYVSLPWNENPPETKENQLLGLMTEYLALQMAGNVTRQTRFVLWLRAHDPAFEKFLSRRHKEIKGMARPAQIVKLKEARRN